MFKLGSKRRRTKQEIADAREEERLRQEGIDSKAAEIQHLTQQLQEAQAIHEKK